MAHRNRKAKKPAYTVVPRTLVFLRHGGSLLLLKGAPRKRLWAGLYNGVGGHVQRGEDIHSAAERELWEETGLTADIWLCGTVLVEGADRDVGACLYIFTGKAVGGSLRPSSEGVPEWIPANRLRGLPTVEDLQILISRIRTMKRGDPAFSARSYHRGGKGLTIEFHEYRVSRRRERRTQGT